MSDAKAIMEMIKENDITYVDLRFTDPRGKMQHVTQHIDTIDKRASPKASCSTARRSPAGRPSTNPT